MAKIVFDYESILERIKNRVLEKLKKAEYGTAESILLFSTNSAVLEACADEIEDAALYDDYLTREAVWETALGYNSIVQQVGFYNYKPHRKIGAKGTVRLSSSKTFDGNWARNIFIPKFTQFSGGGFTFLTREDSFLNNTKNYVDLPVVQGTKIVKDITITESAYPELKYASITIKDPDIEDSLYEVKVNGVTWKEVSSIRLATTSQDKFYTLKNLSDMSGIEIGFGNGVFAKKLEYGDVVTVVYLKTEGETVTSFLQTLLRPLIHLLMMSREIL